jgi:hypothetical protein
MKPLPWRTRLEEEAHKAGTEQGWLAGYATGMAWLAVRLFLDGEAVEAGIALMIMVACTYSWWRRWSRWEQGR